MNINISDKERFIPKANGNDKAEKPIIFNLRFLTVEEQTEMEYFQYSVASNKSIRVKIDNKYIFAHGVESIENLTVDNKLIISADQFLAIRGPKWLSEIIGEVALHLKNSMEIDEKN